MNQPEWNSLVILVNSLRDLWTGNQNKFLIEDSIEKIATGRIRFASMVSGIEHLFSDINQYIEIYEESEKKEDVPLKNLNPYRQG